MNQAVKKAFLKDNSFGKVLNLKYERTPADVQTINIKLEVDMSPPEGSGYENKIITFPVPFNIIAQDLPSLFAGKMHALLCRPFTKGRDWYDLIWYVTRKSHINMPLLENALKQQGPWTVDTIKINKQWVIQNLKKRITNVNWEIARKDIVNFIKPREIDSIELWSESFFLHIVDLLSDYF